MAFFGKAAVHPAPTAQASSKDEQILEMMRQQQNQMQQMQLELARRSGQSTTFVTIPGTNTTVPTTTAPENLYQTVKQQERAEQVASQGGEVTGSGGKSIKELLAPSPTQTYFTRSTDDPNANLHYDDWRRLQADVPADFDEAKYLAKHPDVAEAVRNKVMPSGLYHYVKYGKGEGRPLAGWLAGLAGLRSKQRRRPGYLSGISAPWNRKGY